jgi:hypothetical protein
MRVAVHWTIRRDLQGARLAPQVTGPMMRDDDVPPPPSRMFTDEFYQQAGTRLAPGGILVPWVQAYSIFPDDLKMVLGAVARRFPRVTA